MPLGVKSILLALTLVALSLTSASALVHGPDLDGRYGSLQGTGGLEAVYNGVSGVTTGIVEDMYGHTEATVAGTTPVLVGSYWL